jgi:acyl carrier protein
MDKIIDHLQEIFSEVFPLTKFSGDFNHLKIGDFDEWDSLGNYALLLSIEERLNVRFSTEELSTIRSVEDILNYLKNTKHEDSSAT